MKTAAETSEFPPKLLPKTEVTTVVDSRSVPVQSLKDGRTVAAVKTTADGVEVQPLDADLRISGAREVVPAGDLKDYSRVAAFPVQPPAIADDVAVPAVPLETR